MTGFIWWKDENVVSLRRERKNNMAQGSQVKNGKAFEYAIAKVRCNQVVREFPLRDIVCGDGYYILVAPLEMKDFVMNENKSDYASEAGRIWDDRIAYYATPDEFLLSDEDLLKIIYD